MVQGSCAFRVSGSFRALEFSAILRPRDSPGPLLRFHADLQVCIIEFFFFWGGGFRSFASFARCGFAFKEGQKKSKHCQPLQ